MSRFSFFIGLMLAPVAAFAALPPVIPCSFCDVSLGNSIINNGIAQLGLFFAGLGGGAAVLFGVIGGAQVLLSFGDESKITKGRNSLIFSLAGFALVLASQAIVSFTVASAGNAALEVAGGVNPLLSLMTGIVGALLTALNSLFVLVMVVAGVRMVIGHGKQEEFGKARQTLIYAIVGAFIVNVSHALVSGVLATGFGS